jgi:hypothetical protein
VGCPSWGEAAIVATARAMAAAAFAELQERQRTTRRPCTCPPLATSLTWSAVRSAEGCAGRPAQPGHQSPSRMRCSATAAARRRLSAWSLWRSGRRWALRRSRSRWQSAQRVLPRTVRPHWTLGRMSLLIVACACGVGVAHAGRVGSGRRRRWGGGSRCSGRGAAVGAVPARDVVLARHGYLQRRARVASGTPTCWPPPARTPTTAAPR